MIVSMALQALYNIVDSYFVSCMPDTEQIRNMGDLAVNALTLAFPVQMLMVAISVGTGVGINALLSKSLGAGDRQQASAIAGNSVFLSLCTFGIYLLFMLVGAVILQVFARPLVGIFAVSEETRSLCVLAIRIISLGYLCMGANIGYQGIFQALGHGVQSLLLSLVRLIIVALPLAWGLTRPDNASELVWIAFPAAEACALLLGLLMMRRIRRQVLDRL